ncbi:F-box protein At4g22280-like [Papaver somniferum]|uniref:F-box protein At4g22280-like n=1 Tax=Papaver somniferum TaxID=3469 RepID=UPI000E6FB69D|nr:F-box protein At4g22280-like [Papaver somniferum]
MNFLDTALFIHDKPNIQKFYLGIDESFDESRVNRWITTIMKRKVEEFGLFVKSLNPSSIFPLSFITCNSWTLLDLGFYIKTEFKIPYSISFPKLKILRLNGLSFVNKNSRNFFSNCPILEELSLSYCSISEGLCIVNPALKHLSISSYRLLNNSSVEISAPDLLTITYRGKLPPDFALNSFQSLVEAVVDFYIDDDEEYDYLGKVFVKLFEKLSSATLLKRIDIPEEEYDECWELDPKSSLPRLKSIIFKVFEGQPEELNAVKLFLKYAGVLESLTIEASYWLSTDHQLDVTKLLLTFPRPADCVVKYLTSTPNA